MDPNTLNLKNQSAQSNIPTAQAGGMPQTTGMYAQTPTAPTDAVYTPSAEDQEVLDDIQKELRTRFELLPEEIKNTIISSEYQMKLFELARKYQLSYVDLGQLELETTMVLLGMTKPYNFLGDLKAVIKKNDTVMAALVDEIDTQVFSAIRASLVLLHQEKEEDRENAGMATPPTPTSIPLSQELVSKAPVAQAQAIPLSIKTPQMGGGAPMPQTSFAPTLEKHEDEMLKNSGIEVSTPNETAPLPHSGATPVVSADAFISKLTGVFGVKSKATDHTLPKIGDSTGQINNSLGTASKKDDPYRELL